MRITHISSLLRNCNGWRRFDDMLLGHCLGRRLVPQARATSTTMKGNTMDTGSLEGIISTPLNELASGSAGVAPELGFGSAAIDNLPGFPAKLLQTAAGFIGSLGI